MITSMKLDAVLDQIFHSFPKAKESKSLTNKKPKSDLEWIRSTDRSYFAQGPRGGVIMLRYCARSNKITFRRHHA